MQPSQDRPPLRLWQNRSEFAMLFNAIQHYDGIRYKETGADRRSEIGKESGFENGGLEYGVTAESPPA